MWKIFSCFVKGEYPYDPYSIALRHAEATIDVTHEGSSSFCKLRTIENMGKLPSIRGYYLWLPLTHNLNVRPHFSLHGYTAIS